jgi:hypothetical protein
MLVAASATSVLAGLAGENMNGAYTVANGRGFATNYAGYGNGSVEFFDVYSPPIRSRYSQVIWTMLDAVPLPEELVKRFDGKTMAITGYESDQVIVEEGKPDVSVPITWAYNHHFIHHLNGKHSVLEKGRLPPRAGARHKGLEHLHGDLHGGETWVSRARADDPRPDSEVPVATIFSEGNGGEYRKSYHGYPYPYAQLVDSPVSWNLMPMQIDTKNRDGSMKEPGMPFSPGPLPKASRSRVPTSGPDAIYSGLLECPCTDRISIGLGGSSECRLSDKCRFAVRDAAECSNLVSLLPLPLQPPNTTVSAKTVSSDRLPAGCSAVLDGQGKLPATAVFNTLNSSKVSCGVGGVSGDARLAGRLVIDVTDPTDQRVLLFRRGLSLDLDAPSSIATLTLFGPSDKWFAVGLNASDMADMPYAISIDADGSVSEHRLANHAFGSKLTPSVKVVSSSVKDGTRTVVLTRPLKGATPQHYTFDPAAAASSLPVISAVGHSGEFTSASHHDYKAASTLSLFAANGGSATCVCRSSPVPPPFGDTANATVLYQGGDAVTFNKHCTPYPGGQLLSQRNPTCDARYYQGGLRCCHHEWFLLDREQTPPDDVLEYRIKVRFYFQPHDASSHTNIWRFGFATDAGSGEYDIPQCNRSTTPTKQCVHEIVANLKVSDFSDMAATSCDLRNPWNALSPACKNGSIGFRPVYLGAHCHAPACLSEELYNADSGELICRNVPSYGGRASGATGAHRFEELGYLALPPCVWGDPALGLVAPPLLRWETNLISIKKVNSTYGHTGEMALWQGRGVLV